MIKLLFSLSLTLILLISCTTLDRKFIEDENNRVTLDDIRLEMDYEVYHFRADLIRQTTIENVTTTDSVRVFSTDQEDKDVPYHYVGLRLGNGLFLDYNHNLSVDLVEFFNLGKSDFSIIRKGNAMDPGNVTIEYHKSDEMFTRNVKTFLGQNTTAQFGDDSAFIIDGLFRSEINVVKTDQKVLCIPRGIFGFLSKVEIERKDDSTVVIPGFWQDSVFELRDSDTLEMGNQFIIEKLGSELLIEFQGMFGITTTYHFIRTANGFMFYDDNYRGVTAERNGDTIRVEEYNQLDFTAKILK